LITGAAIEAISLVLIFGIMMYFNPVTLTVQNVIAYVVFSSVLGTVAAVLQYFELDFALLFFIGGIGIGFFQLFRSLSNNINGWGDLAGIAYLITYIVIGLLAGILAQVYIWFVNKIKKNK